MKSKQFPVFIDEDGDYSTFDKGIRDFEPVPYVGQIALEQAPPIMKSIQDIRNEYIGTDQQYLERYISSACMQFSNIVRTISCYYSRPDYTVSYIEHEIMEEYKNFNMLMDMDMVNYLIKDEQRALEYFNANGNKNVYLRLCFVNTLLVILEHIHAPEDFIQHLLTIIEDISFRSYKEQSILINNKWKRLELYMAGKEGRDE